MSAKASVTTTTTDDFGGFRGVAAMSRRFIVSALRAAGWVNPDGVGVLWYHPAILDGKECPISMTLQVAVDVEAAREAEA